MGIALLYLFRHKVPLEAVADEGSSRDVLVDADLSFAEACLDPDNNHEHIPASLTLTIKRIDYNGSLIDEDYFISQEELQNGQKYAGSYLHSSSSGHELMDMFDNQYARDLTEHDLALMQAAIDSMPETPQL